MPTGSRSAKIKLETSTAGMDAGLKEASRKLRAFQREQEKNAKKAEREADRAAKRMERSQDRASRKAKAEDDKRAKQRNKHLREAGDKGAGFGHSVAHGIGAAAGFDIAGVVGDAAKSVFDTEKELTRFSIDANLSASQIAAFREEVTETSNATGQSRGDLVKAAHAYQILTGDAKGATEVVGTFADVSNASGASMDNIAEAAASMRQNLHLDPKDFRKGFDVLLNLGHKGALELRDFAGELSGLAPQFNQFGTGTSVEKLTELGAAMEIVKLNFKDGAETATGMRAAMVAISKDKVDNKLEGLGVKVWTIDPKTKQHIKRDFFDIIGDLKKKVPDMKILEGALGGRQESTRAIEAMLEHYDELTKLRAEAANSDQVSVDAHKYMESSAGRMQVAWTKIQNAIASALTPERVEAFASALEKAAEFVGHLVDMANRLLNGPGKEEEENRIATWLVDTTNSDVGGRGSGKGEEIAIANAKDIINSDEAAKNWVEGDVGGAGVGGANPENIAAARKAASEYLKTEGILMGDSDPWSGKHDAGAGVGVSTGKMDPQAMQQLGREFARSAAAELSKIGITLKANPNAIAASARSAPLHRGTGH